MTKTLRLILGDQLSHDISCLEGIDKKSDMIFLCEVKEEATYVKHHKKKITFLFSAMRHFAEELKEKGFIVRYTKYSDKKNAGSFKEEVKRAIQEEKVDKVIVTFPGEYRVWKDMQQWEEDFNVDVEIRDDDRFLSTIQEFKEWAEGRKQLRMEYFYREMRKKHNILMDANKPEGGEWNYDSENRKPPKEGLDVPSPFNTKIDNTTQECIDLVAENFDDHFGDLEPFYFA
ncbi:MAG: cryptochrome/photolyase family protein, partial [Pseudomonadota bacterium]